MTRRFDPARKRQRDEFLAAILFAHGDLAALTNAGSEILARTIALVGSGHHVGDRLTRYARQGVETLDHAQSLLAQSVDAAHGIDITVEVPEAMDR
jgi:hypothetical protein